MALDDRTLVRLSDTGRTVADPAADVRGRRVADRAGDDLGRIDDLLVDGTGRVRFLRVEHGGVLGLGAVPSFIPVDALTRVTDEEVTVDPSRERVAGAPRYDPDLADEGEAYGRIYDYYGYVPFWGAGYTPPSFPYRS